MIRILKWAVLAVLVLAVAGFLVFLYSVPPFFSTPPEDYSKAVHDAAPGVTGIADPAQRALAERGREIVVRTGCIGCHATNGDQGPDYSKYLAGGGLKLTSTAGTYVSPNLTPDGETGIGRRSNDELKRVLKSGVFPDGHIVPYSMMPWGAFANWTEEDRHAVVIYLRSLKAVRHAIPQPDARPAPIPLGVVERDYGFKDYGTTPAH